MGKFIDFAPRKVNQSTNQTVAKSNKPHNSNAIYIVIIIALVIVFIYSLNSLFSQTPVISGSPESTTKPSVAGNNVSTTNNKTAELNSSPQNNENACNGNDCSPSNPAVLSKEKINIEILNGSGKPDSAAETKRFLEDQGYKISSIDNANNLYQTTVVYFKNGNDALANDLANTLTGYVTSIQENSELVGEYDILIVVGQK